MNKVSIVALRELVELRGLILLSFYSFPRSWYFPDSWSSPYTHTQVAIDPYTQWSSGQSPGALPRLCWPANPIFLKSPLTQLWSFSSVQQAMCAFSLLVLHSGSCFQAEIQVIVELPCFSYFMDACCLISKNYCYILFILFSGCLPLNVETTNVWLYFFLILLAKYLWILEKRTFNFHVCYHDTCGSKQWRI